MRKPRGFRGAEEITSVQLSSRSPVYITPPKLKGKIKAGIVYEAAVHSYYSKIYKDKYYANPWFKYEERRGSRWCQPDAYILDKELRTIIIVECKLKHCSKSWWQLHKLYYPVIKAYYGDDWTYSLLEVTSILDPATYYPSHINKVNCIQKSLPYPVTNVMLWRA